MYIYIFTEIWNTLQNQSIPNMFRRWQCMVPSILLIWPISGVPEAAANKLQYNTPFARTQFGCTPSCTGGSMLCLSRSMALHAQTYPKNTSILDKALHRTIDVFWMFGMFWSVYFQLPFSFNPNACETEPFPKPCQGPQLHQNTNRRHIINLPILFGDICPQCLTWQSRWKVYELSA